MSVFHDRSFLIEMKNTNGFRQPAKLDVLAQYYFN